MRKMLQLGDTSKLGRVALKAKSNFLFTKVGPDGNDLAYYCRQILPFLLPRFDVLRCDFVHRTFPVFFF